MKKSQVAASLALASVLGFTSMATPLVYAVEGDTSAGVIQEADRGELLDRIVETLNSLEFEPSAEDAAKFEALEAAAEFATPEVMAKIKKVVAAKYNSNGLDGLTAKQFVELLTKQPIDKTVKLIVELRDLSGEELNQAVAKLTDQEIASLLSYANRDNVEAKLNAPAISGFLPADFDLDDVETWDDVKELVMIFITDDINQNYVYKNANNTYTATLQDLADFYAVYDKVVEGVEAEQELAELEAGTHEDSKAYAYWKTFNSIMNMSELSDDELATAFEEFEAAAIAVGAYSPVATRTLTDKNGIVTVTGRFAANYQLAVEASDAKVAGEGFENSKQVAYNIYITDGKGNEVEIKDDVIVTVKVATLDAAKTEVYYIDAEGNSTQLEITSVAGDEITFSVGHFSIYAFVQKAAAVDTPDEDFAGVDADADKGFNVTPVKPVVTIGDGQENSTTPVKAPIVVDSPDTGVAMRATSSTSANANVTLGLVAGLIAVIGATIAAIARFVRRNA